MKRNVWLAGLGLLSVLGLFSCSSDKPDNTWALTEPVIQANELDQLRLSEASSKTLPGDSSLVFRESETAGTSTNIRASCQSSIGEIFSEMSVRDITRVELRSLWPTQMFLQLKDEQLLKSSCSFAFVMTTDSGSSHQFNLASISLKNFINVDRSKTPALVSTANSEEFMNQMSELLETTQHGKTYLSCENFWNQTESPKSVTQQSSALEKLFVGPLHSSTKAMSSLDPRTVRSEQDCRLINITENQTHVGRAVNVTATFKVHFPTPALQISSKMFGGDLTPLAPDRFAFFEITVKSQSDTATAIRLEALPQVLRFQKIILGRLMDPSRFREGELGLAPKVNSVHLTYEYQTQGRTWQKNGAKILELNPGDEIRVRAIVETPCFSMLNGLPSSYDARAVADRGYYFDLDKPLSLDQFHNWDVTNIDLDRSSQIKMLMDLKTGTDNPRNFSPFKALQDVEGYSAADPMSDLQLFRASSGYANIECYF